MFIIRSSAFFVYALTSLLAHYFIWKDVQYLLFLRNFKGQTPAVSNLSGIINL